MWACVVIGHIALAGALAIVPAVLNSCEPEPSFIRVDEYTTDPFEISPPTRLDLMMHRDKGAVRRCHTYGGVFLDAGPDGWLCVGVDY